MDDNKGLFFNTVIGFLLLSICNGCKSIRHEEPSRLYVGGKYVISPELANDFGEVVRARATIEDSRLKSGGGLVRIDQYNGILLEAPIVLRMDNGSPIRYEESLAGRTFDVIGYESVEASGIPSALLESSPAITVQGYAVVNTFVVSKIVRELN